MVPARVRTSMPMTTCSGMWGRGQGGSRRGAGWRAGPQPAPGVGVGGSIIGEGMGQGSSGLRQLSSCNAQTGSDKGITETGPEDKRGCGRLRGPRRKELPGSALSTSQGIPSGPELWGWG